MFTAFITAAISMMWLGGEARVQDNAKRTGSTSMPGVCMANGPHDSATMAQMSAMHTLVTNHDQIVRSVTYLPNGVLPTTESDNPKIAALIKDHVAAMEQLVREGKDPQLPMESPAVHTIFLGESKVNTVTQVIPTGIILEQTSRDPAIVEALQQHAAELGDLIDRGMAAMHETMMKNAGPAKRSVEPQKKPNSPLPR